MRRRDHGRARPWRQFNSIGNDHALPVHRHRDGCNIHMSQQFSRRRVSGVFKPDAISRLQQCMRDQLDGVAISRCHEYLRWRAVDPARNLQICGDLGTQLRQAVYGGMHHVGWLHGAHTSRAEARPDFSGKHIQRRQAHLERQDRTPGESWPRQCRYRDRGIGLATGVRGLRPGVTMVPAWPRA